MTAPDLPAFLLARAADREREAPNIHRADCEAIAYDYGGIALGPCDCGEPARVLAECAAKRALVQSLLDHRKWYAENPDARHFEAMAATEAAVATLAEVHADHPDYRDEWRLDD